MCSPFLYSFSQVEKYRNALKDIMDAFFDMSPLEYAETRGLQDMSDCEGERIKDRARAVLADKI